MIHFIGEGFVLRGTLLEENKVLKDKVTTLEADLLRLNFLEKENAELQSLAHPDFLKGRSFIVARVLAVDGTVYLSELIINQGEHQGVFVGQIVADSQGILGQVIQTNATTSRIQLITDTASGIPVQFLNNGVRGIAVGEGNQGKLLIKYVPITTQVKIGEELVTSGLGGHFPQGYPIARVVNMSIQPGDTFLQIEAVPIGNVTGANFVLLLVDKNQNIKKKK